SELHADQLVTDIVYTPLETDLLRTAAIPVPPLWRVWLAKALRLVGSTASTLPPPSGLWHSLSTFGALRPGFLAPRSGGSQRQNPKMPYLSKNRTLEPGASDQT
ncbi:MAG: hypothetical protein VXW43_03450, partial [Pseudomonadota bacterium]|nr:hypothetical protein [Pseudomonadota bacterium]